MSNSLLASAVVVVALVGMWALLIARLGYLTPDDVRAWRRLASLRGYARPQTRLERAADRSPALRRLREELDLGRLLAVANRAETETAFLGRTAAVALLAFTTVVVIDTAARVSGGDFIVPPWTALLAAIAAVLWRFATLRAAARRRRDNAGRALGDMMMLVAILTDGRGLQLEDAVRILARCASNDDLRTLVDGGWRTLIGARPASTATLYTAIGAEFRIPQFVQVAEALTTTHVGVAERDTYSRVAHAVYQQRLGEARVRAARARILVTLPVAGMLIPLLLLLGAPTFANLASGIGGG